MPLALLVPPLESGAEEDDQGPWNTEGDPGCVDSLKKITDALVSPELGM